MGGTAESLMFRSYPVSEHLFNCSFNVDIPLCELLHLRQYSTCLVFDISDQRQNFECIWGIQEKIGIVQFKEIFINYHYCYEILPYLKVGRQCEPWVSSYMSRNTNHCSIEHSESESGEYLENSSLLESGGLISVGLEEDEVDSQLSDICGKDNTLELTESIREEAFIDDSSLQDCGQDCVTVPTDIPLFGLSDLSLELRELGNRGFVLLKGYFDKIKRHIA